MTSEPKQRFIRLNHADPHLAGVTTTFLSAAAGAAPDVDNHGVLASVAATDPRRAERIQSGLRALIAREQTVMSWLESDAANAALFARDPVAALRAALDLPADFFEGWR